MTKIESHRRTEMMFALANSDIKHTHTSQNDIAHTSHNGITRAIQTHPHEYSGE